MVRLEEHYLRVCVASILLRVRIYYIFDFNRFVEKEMLINLAENAVLPCICTMAITITSKEVLTFLASPHLLVNVTTSILGLWLSKTMTWVRLLMWYFSKSYLMDFSSPDIVIYHDGTDGGRFDNLRVFTKEGHLYECEFGQTLDGTSFMAGTNCRNIV